MMSFMFIIYRNIFFMLLIDLIYSLVQCSTYSTFIKDSRQGYSNNDKIMMNSFIKKTQLFHNIISSAYYQYKLLLTFCNLFKLISPQGLPYLAPLFSFFCVQFHAQFAFLVSCSKCCLCLYIIVLFWLLLRLF